MTLLRNCLYNVHLRLCCETVHTHGIAVIVLGWRTLGNGGLALKLDLEGTSDELSLADEFSGNHASVRTRLIAI